MERTQEEIINITTRDTIWQPREGHEVGEKELDPDGGNQRLCHLCTLPIFSTPYETKEAEGEDRRRHHFFHKRCAKLPQTLTDHPLHRRQPLHLHHLPDGCSDVFCHTCRRECEGFFYQCLGSGCRFTLDILCAVTVKILHRSHKHELTLIRRRENRFTCSACGLEHEGEFYSCDVCGFYLHRDCALLPNAIVHKKHGDGQGQQHPLVLSFAFPENALKFKKDDSCSICHESLLWGRSGIYFCTKCSYTTHVKCAISDPHDFLSVSIAEAANTLIQFPMIESEHTSLVQFLLNKEKERDNKYCWSGNGGSNEGIGYLNKVLIKKIHHHELIFHENDGDNQHSEPHFCNACYFPIYPPFYTCPQSQCTDFYLHHCCANLPLHYHHPSMHYVFGRETCRDRPLKLLPRFSDTFLHIFKCSGCNNFCNGFVYGCEDCSVQLELRCAMRPEAITYQKHSNSHILLLSRGGLPGYLNMCHSCKKQIWQHDFYYECCSCPNFKLHFNCTLLALNVSHKYDRHPLHLASPEFSTPKEGFNNKDGDVFCEICEEVMNDQQWFYQCKECVTSFHTRCIPFTGGKRKYKMGETVRVRCHDCPLTSIHMAFNYSYPCGICKKTIQGKKLQVVFECVKCGYWLHWRCAKKQWISN